MRCPARRWRERDTLVFFLGTAHSSGVSAFGNSGTSRSDTGSSDGISIIGALEASRRDSTDSSEKGAAAAAAGAAAAADERLLADACTGQAQLRGCTGADT